MICRLCNETNKRRRSLTENPDVPKSKSTLDNPDERTKRRGGNRGRKSRSKLKDCSAEKSAQDIEGGESALFCFDSIRTWNRFRRGGPLPDLSYGLNKGEIKNKVSPCSRKRTLSPTKKNKLLRESLKDNYSTVRALHGARERKQPCKGKRFSCADAVGNEGGGSKEKRPP